MNKDIKDMTKEEIKKAFKPLGDIFWNSLDYQLNKIRERDGLNTSQEQEILTALMVLHYRTKELEEKLKVQTTKKP